jgi:hypothetical protein
MGESDDPDLGVVKPLFHVLDLVNPEQLRM